MRIVLFFLASVLLCTPCLAQTFFSSGFEEGESTTEPSTLVRLTDDQNFSACHFKPTASQPRKNMPDKPFFIKHGWDIPQTNYLVNNDGSAKTEFVNQLNTRPFDGVVFGSGKLTHGISDISVSEAEAENAIKPFDVANLTKPTHNYIMLYIHPVTGGFKGDNDAQIVQNMRHLARAASKRPELAGVVFDAEFYPSNTYGTTPPWDYSAANCAGYTGGSANNGFADPADKEACDIHAYNRGYRIMKAMIAEWPDMEVLNLFGIWTDDPRTFYLVNGAWNNPNTGYAPHYEWHNKQSLMPHFLSGMYAATICTDATYIDGTELYGLREQSDFETTGQFITNDIADNNPFLPQNIQAAYKAEVGLGFGIYDDRQSVFVNHAKWPTPNMTPTTWKNTIINAGRVATHTVWAYTEIHDWWRADVNDWPEEKAVEDEPSWLKQTQEAARVIKQ